MDFYAKVLGVIIKHNVPFLIGGGFAVHQYTGIDRVTHDLDIYCKGGDYPKIVNILKKSGMKVRVLDERWIAQALNAKDQVDIIFSSPNYLINVDDDWFKYAPNANLFGYQIKLVPKEELIWSKSYTQDRDRFDGADISHLILVSRKGLDWHRLLNRIGNNWEVLLAIILNFRFIYPSERNIVPNWLIEELILRLNYQLKNPTPRDKVCRGPLLSRTQYKEDITKFGFETIS